MYAFFFSQDDAEQAPFDNACLRLIPTNQINGLPTPLSEIQLFEHFQENQGYALVGIRIIDIT
jgi:hypothetical protein